MAGFNRLRRSGRPRLDPLPALTSATPATITGSARPGGTQVRLMMTALVNAGQPLPTNPVWTAPITTGPNGKFTTSMTPAAAGPIKFWVALVKNPTNMWGQTATVA